jgi:hypothetical protein
MHELMGDCAPEQDCLLRLYLDNLRAEPDCSGILVREEENFDFVVPMQTVIGMGVEDVAEESELEINDMFFSHGLRIVDKNGLYKDASLGL